MDIASNVPVLDTTDVVIMVTFISVEFDFQRILTCSNILENEQFF